jgi:uroporphyrinogen-III synthase
LRVLLTRPRDDTAALADKLKAAGHDVLGEPMLEIRFLSNAGVDLAGAQAVLFTSANGVRAFAAVETRRDLPVFAVGDTTAAAARAAGFTRVESAAGRVDDLARLVRERLSPADGALVHAAGRDVAGDLAGAMGQSGFELRRAVLYIAEPARALSSETARALKSGTVDAVIFYSARTAETFGRLVNDAGLASSLSHAIALGLSPAALEPIKSLPWARIEAATRPDESELMRLLARYEADAVRPPEAPAAPPRRGIKGLFAALNSTKARPTAQPRPRFLVPMVWLAVLLSLGTFFLQTTQPPAPAPGLSGAASLRLAMLERRLDALARDQGQAAPDRETAARLKTLSDRVDALDARPPASPEQGDLAALSRRVDDLQTQLTDAQKKISAQPASDQLAALTTANQQLSQQVADLQKQVAGLATAHRSNAARDSVLLAVGQIELAAASGTPIAPALSTLRPLASGDPRLAAAVAELQPVADRPVPSFEALAERFPAVATAAARAAQGESIAAASDNGTNSWWRGIVQRLSAAVTIRRVGDIAGDSPDARIARAEQHLAAHDLQGAVDALAGLTAAPARAVASWVGDARARLALDKAMGNLSAAAIAATQPPP